MPTLVEGDALAPSSHTPSLQRRHGRSADFDVLASPIFGILPPRRVYGVAVCPVDSGVVGLGRVVTNHHKAKRVLGNPIPISLLVVCKDHRLAHR